MKIGMVVPARGFRGGVERHAHDLARALAERGHGVVLIHGEAAGRDEECFAQPFERVVALRDPGAARGVDVVYFHGAHSAEELRPFGALPVAVAVHDHELTCVRPWRYLPVGHTPCNRAPGAACVLHGCVLARGRGYYAAEPERGRSPFALRRQLGELARRALLLPCSGYVAWCLMSAGAPPERVRVIHPLPPEDPAPVRPRPPEPRLLVAGQLVEGKGFDLAVSALRHMPPEVKLDIVGEGPAEPKLRALASRVGSERVAFHGYVPPALMRERYDAVSVVLVPSRWPEPFGMIGLEAMRRARPVVGAAHGGILEWLADGNGGRLFPPGDVRALAARAAELLADGGAGAHAWRRARERFAPSRAVDAVDAVLRGLTSRRAA